MKIPLPNGKEIYVHEILDESYQTFVRFGFNIKSDIKKNKLKESDVRRILKDITEYFNSVTSFTALYATNDVKLVTHKFRGQYRNTGKSGGIRVILLVVFDVEIHIFPIHLYLKSGSNRKDNLTSIEKNNLKKLMDVLAREDKEENDYE